MTYYYYYYCPIQSGLRVATDGALVALIADYPLGGLEVGTLISWAKGGVKGLLPFSIVSCTGIPP